MPLPKTQFAVLCLLAFGMAIVIARPMPVLRAEAVAPGGMQFQIPQAAVPITERQVCSLLNKGREDQLHGSAAGSP